jgi:hypothetical protein
MWKSFPIDLIELARDSKVSSSPEDESMGSIASI